MGKGNKFLTWFLFGSGEFGDGSCPIEMLDKAFKPAYERALEKRTEEQPQTVTRTNTSNGQMSTQEAYRILGLDERTAKITDAFTQRQLYAGLYQSKPDMLEKGLTAYNIVCRNISKLDLEKRTRVLSR